MIIIIIIIHYDAHDIDVGRKQAQAIASLPDSHNYYV